MRQEVMMTDDPDTLEIWKVMLGGRVAAASIEMIDVPVLDWYDPASHERAWAEAHPEKTVKVWRMTVTYGEEVVA